jgi:hypothetical protein
VAITKKELNDEIKKVTDYVTARHEFVSTEVSSLLGTADLEFATVKPMLEEDVSIMEHELKSLIGEDDVKVYIADE